MKEESLEQPLCASSGEKLSARRKLPPNKHFFQPYSSHLNFKQEVGRNFRVTFHVKNFSSLIVLINIFPSDKRAFEVELLLVQKADSMARRRQKR